MWGVGVLVVCIMLSPIFNLIDIIYIEDDINV